MFVVVPMIMWQIQGKREKTKANHVHVAMLNATIAIRRGISKSNFTNGKGNRKKSLLTHKTRVALIHPRIM